VTDIPNGIARLRAAGRHGRTVLADAQMTRTFRIGRPGVIGLAVLLLGAGCTSPIYTMERYGTAPVYQVHLGCHDTYEVFDRPDAGAILVGTNALNESLSAVCSEGAAGLPREERLRRAARIYFDETSKRPTCRITRETPLSPLQTEFNYICTPPVAAPIVPGRPRRG
jgi:hypothetical protein